MKITTSLKTSAMALLLLASTAGSNAIAALPFVENDYARAVEQARGKNLPIFVDNWAPW